MVGKPHELLGDEICAVVVSPRGSAVVPALTAWARERMSPYMPETRSHNEQTVHQGVTTDLQIVERSELRVAAVHHVDPALDATERSD